MTNTQVPQATPLASLKRYCRQEAETALLAQKLAGSVAQWISNTPDGHLNIALEGDLGAGKTTFARFLIQALGYQGKVKSPTYTLCEPYSIQSLLTNPPIAFVVHHFDLYRMRDPLEWQEAGFAEYFDVPGFCLIEWPEKAMGTLPALDIQICLKAGAQEDERDIEIYALSVKSTKVIESIQVNP